MDKLLRIELNRSITLTNIKSGSDCPDYCGLAAVSDEGDNTMNDVEILGDISKSITHFGGTKKLELIFPGGGIFLVCQPDKWGQEA
jgi:hypothetical protein